MARRIAVSTLSASTIDILNVIRQNASYDYQSSVPVVSKATDIPKVGEVIYGTPALANQFLNALVNRIASVRVQSATFNNPYAVLKKGYLEFGESIEEIFVSIAKGVDYSAEKGASREFKRTIPDVRSLFHIMNWRVMYPVTIQDEDLRMAFLSVEGVTNLIAKIVDAVYTGAEYDEFLLFKYLLIKAVTKGKMYPVSIGDGTDLKQAGKMFRGTSNLLPFMTEKYNGAGVKTTTPKERQVIFLDALFDSEYDVEVLASAFNMDKAEFMGRRFLIDDWTTFDNERFDIIRENSDGLEEVTSEELELMKDVVGILLDENWFQVYDNNNKFTEKYVASGMYWNYFYHTWKTISFSDFSNAVVFAKSSATITLPASFTVEIQDKSTVEEAVVLSLVVDDENPTLEPMNVQFVQTEQATTNGIAIQKYGAVLIPANKVATNLTLKATIDGVEYTATSTINGSKNVGDTITFSK